MADMTRQFVLLPRVNQILSTSKTTASNRTSGTAKLQGTELSQCLFSPIDW